MSWTQAICVKDWNLQNPDSTVPREGHSFVDGGGNLERCAYCGEETRSGIYVRDNPKTVPFPREEVPA